MSSSTLFSPGKTKRENRIRRLFGRRLQTYTDHSSDAQLTYDPKPDDLPIMEENGPEQSTPPILSLNEVELPSNSNSAIIRVITPKSAQKCSDAHSALLLNGGNPISLTMTLRQLKLNIGNLLSVQNLYLPEKPSSPSSVCNCALARSIVKNGIWEMLKCRTHDSSHEDCDYPHVNTSKDGQCLLCLEALAEPCQRCQEGSGVVIDPCPLVSNVGCNHTFHHHCYTEQLEKTCPGGCSISYTPKSL